MPGRYIINEMTHSRYAINGRIYCDLRTLY